MRHNLIGLTSSIELHVAMRNRLTISFDRSRFGDHANLVRTSIILLYLVMYSRPIQHNVFDQENGRVVKAIEMRVDKQLLKAKISK